MVAYAGTGRTPFSGGLRSRDRVRILTQPPDLTGLPARCATWSSSALAKDPARPADRPRLLDRLLASAPSPSPTARRHEVPFLREVMRSGEHAAPDRPSQRPAAGGPYRWPARPAPGRATRWSGAAWSSTAGSATARSGAAPVGPAAVSAPPAQSPEPASSPIVSAAAPGRPGAAPQYAAGRVLPGRAMPPAGRPVAQVRRGDGRCAGGDPGERRRHRADHAAGREPGLPRAGNDGGGPDEAAGPTVRNAPITSAVPADPDGVEAILNGERRACCHVQEIDKDLSLTGDGARSSRRRRATHRVHAGAQRHGLSDPHPRAGRGRPALPGRPAGRRPHRGAGRRSMRERLDDLFDLTATGKTDINRPRTT